MAAEPAHGVAVLKLCGVAKAFGPVLALRSGSIRVEAGSIHALVGENSAGKSTLVKIVAGVQRRDAGECSSTAHRSTSGRRPRPRPPGSR